MYTFEVRLQASLRDLQDYWLLADRNNLQFLPAEAQEGNTTDVCGMVISSLQVSIILCNPCVLPKSWHKRKKGLHAGRRTRLVIRPLPSVSCPHSHTPISWWKPQDASRSQKMHHDAAGSSPQSFGHHVGRQGVTCAPPSPSCSCCCPSAAGKATCKLRQAKPRPCCAACNVPAARLRPGAKMDSPILASSSAACSYWTLKLPRLF